MSHFLVWGLWGTFLGAWIGFFSSFVLVSSLGALGQHRHASSVGGGAFGLLLLTLALSMIYVGIAGLINRTSFTVGPSTAVRRDRPLPWERTVSFALVPGATARAFAVRKNDVRHFSARWPRPLSHEVRFIAPGIEDAVLFDFLGNEESAILAASVARVLRAMSPPDASGVVPGDAGGRPSSEPDPE